MAYRQELAELRKHVWVKARQGRFDIMHPGEYQLSVAASWGIEDDQKARFLLDPEHGFEMHEDPAGQLLELGRAYLALPRHTGDIPGVRRMVEWLEAGDDYVDEACKVYIPSNMDVMNWACAHREVARLGRRAAWLEERLRNLRRLTITDPWSRE